MNPLHQQIFDGIIARFAGVTVANGFNTDIGLCLAPESRDCWIRRNVDADAGSPVSVDELADLGGMALCLYDRAGDGGGGVNQAPIGSWGHNLHISAVGYFIGGTPDTTAWLALADLLRAIGSDPRWSNLATNTDEAVKYTVGLVQIGEVLAGLRLDFVVQYRTKRWEV